MALSATVEWDVRDSGNDTYGGGWNTASSGVDYSQQSSPQVAINNSSITTSVNGANVGFTLGYTPSANDVGNIMRVVSGTNMTAGTVYEIISVTATGWVCDRSIPSAGTTTNMIANMGGSLRTPGRAFTNNVNGHKIWLKYSTAPYLSTTTSTNVGSGFINTSTGSQAVQLLFRGYENTHGDIPTTRPTMKVGVNAGTTALIVMNSVMRVEYLILDCNRANFTQTKAMRFGGSTNEIVSNVKIMGCNVSAVDSAGTDRVTFINCEFTDCTSDFIRATAGGHIALIGCYLHDLTGTGDGVVGNAPVSVFGYFTVFDTIKNGAANEALNFSTTSMYSRWENCVFYNSGADGVLLSANGTHAFINCVFESNGRYGINPSAAGTHGVTLQNCAFYNNTSGKYDTTKIPAVQITGEILGSGTFFTDAANGDFTLNNTTSQGALLRNAGFPSSLPGASSTVNYMDVGAARHIDPSGGGGMLVHSGMLGGMRG